VSRTEASVDLGCAGQEQTFGEALREQVDIDEVPGGSPVEEREHLTSSKVLRAEGGPSDGYRPRLARRCVHGQGGSLQFVAC
jgi:hypothetical protein